MTAGLAVPADLSVVGYDNIPLSGYTLPSLTTVDQPKQALGRRAVALCLDGLAGKPVTDEVLDGQLVIRQSARPGRGPRVLIGEVTILSRRKQS